MSSKTLSDILEGVSITGADRWRDVEVAAVAYDSRRVSPGAVFVALEGDVHDGHDFIEDAVRRGAGAIVHSSTVARRVGGAVLIEVDDTRRALSRISSNFFDQPSRELRTFGVTGTDGKSTTVYLIHQLLSGVGIASGFLSTPLLQTAEETVPNPFRNSTPESLEVHRILREMVTAGRTHSVIEATSHGLSPRTSRLADVGFDVAVFTNLSHEHLEFHGTYEQYRNDKANLFRALDRSPNGIGVVNVDDEAAPFFSAVSQRPVFAYSTTRSDADLFATGTTETAEGTAFDLHCGDDSYSVLSPFHGSYNVSNLLAAVLAVHKGAGIEIERILPAVAGLEGLPGRMVELGPFRGSRVVVDYAHTPGAFQSVLPQLRSATESKLIVVFGSAGDRDRAKRPLQGAVAGAYADIVILADEDPRSEDRYRILEDIASGIGERRPESLRLIPDRRQAIRTALTLAEPGDTVALLGKGHESSIIYRDGPLEWNEVEVARALMRELSSER